MNSLRFLFILSLLFGFEFANATCGAIVFDRTSGAMGYSYGFPNRISAERSAQLNCNRVSSSCTVLTWECGMCTAIAYNGSTPQHYATGSAYDMNSAIRAAQVTCGRDCNKYRAVCN